MKRAAVVLAALALALPALPSADALERDPMQLSRQNPKASGNYGTFVGADPLLIGDQDTCRTQTNCDTIDIVIDPSGWGSDFFVSARITLEWDSPAADLDMYVYDATHTEVGASATGGHPEVAGWSIDGTDTQTYSAVIHNFAGGEGVFYDLTVELSASKLKALPKLILPTPPPTIAPLATLPPPPTSNDSGGGGAEAPVFTFPPLSRPGADGDPTSVKLTAIQAAAARDEAGGMSGWIILGIAAGGLAALGGTGVLLRRRVAGRRT